MTFDKTQQYQAYKAATHTVSKTRQVVMLYDGAIRFTKQAKAAITENRIEDRFNLLNKVGEVMIGLQASLDFVNGGEIAPLLYDYYSSIDSRIIYVQRTNDIKVLDSVIAELKQMRGAWGDIDARSEAGDSLEPKAGSVEKAKSETSLSTASQAQASQSANTADKALFVSA